MYDFEYGKSAINRYRLPVPRNLLDRVDRSSSPIHIGNLRNAIDFIVLEHSPVLAAANGIVTYVKDDSIIGGPNPIYQKYTNFITIAHANEEYSRYDHLTPQSSKIEVGQTVKEGQQIAKVGMTGYTLVPHLHFHVFIFTGRNV
ncbi:MAG TPA: M23 family metallopeptidase [Candidatus Bathyarchaeia archaeon]|nr:M23 family metallopeptidase [Candidatus Bathyarchaeia archaeon]